MKLNPEYKIIYESLMKELEAAEWLIIKKLSSRIDWILWISLFLSPFLLIWWVWVFQKYLYNGGEIIFGTLLLVFLLWVASMKFWNFLKQNIQQKFQIIIQQHKNLLSSLVKRDEIEFIAKKVGLLYTLMNYTIEISRKYRLPRIRTMIMKEAIFVQLILTDLRSDLAIRLSEQQKTLEQAKSEVEQTIKWSTELEQVSELQQARLDRQIEQFEELQKVLVKA